MNRFLLRIWKWTPFWLQRLASNFLRPRYQVAVGAILQNSKGELLLCEHTYRREYPWGLPGGDVKPGEDPDEAVRREVQEETGQVVNEVELLFIENSAEYHHLGLIYRCKGVKGAFSPNAEVSRIQFFDVKALPPLFPNEGKIVERVFFDLSAEGRMKKVRSDILVRG